MASSANVKQRFDRFSSFTVWQSRIQVVHPPHVVRPFFTVAVGVHGRFEPSRGIIQFSLHEFHHHLGASPQCRVSLKGPSFGREAQNLGVVIEHLFKMRDVPALVDAVPGIPATDVIVDATAFHREQGVHAVQRAFVRPFFAKQRTCTQAQGQSQ